MSSIRPTMFLVLVTCLLRAQPLPDREALAKIPLDEAIVLDPAGDWWFYTPRETGDTLCMALDQEAGHPMMMVTAPGRSATWCRLLAIPIYIERYPLAVVTYRARGIEPSDEPCLSINQSHKAASILLSQQDIVADGEIHEETVDLLRPLPNGRVGTVEIRLHCRGPEPAVFELLGLRFRADYRPLPLQERKADEITVQVVDGAGKGIPGATVTSDAERLNAAYTVLTDTTGRAVVPTAGNAFNQHTLRVASAGMYTVDFPGRTMRPLPATVTLEPGTRYGGTVKNEEGEPVPMAVARLWMTGKSTPGEGSRTTTVVTDAAGKWQSPILSADIDRCSLGVHHPDYVAGTYSPAPVHALRSGTAVQVLRRGAVLRGTVRDPDGHPLAKAKLVRSHRASEWEAESVWSDDQGRFAFLPLSEMNTTVLAQCPGYAPVAMDVACSPDLADLAIRLGPAATIRGQVVDQEGNPIRGARLYVSAWGRVQCRLWDAETDAEGRFAWPDAPADAVTFALYKPGYMGLRSFPLTADEEEQRIVLAPPLQVTGIIRDAETGIPISGAQILPGMYRVDQGDRPMWLSHGAKTTADGRYEHTFQDTSCGFAVKAEASGYLSEVSPRLAPGEKSVTVDFALRRAAEIAGTVCLPDGQPAAGAVLCLATEDRRLSIDDGQPRAGFTNVSVVTGPDGRYRLPVEQERWQLAACHPEGYAETNADWYASSPDLRLETWGRIEGTYFVGSQPKPDGEIMIQVNSRWVDADGKAIPSFVGHYRQAASDDKGEFSAEHVPPGKGSVAAMLPCGPSIRRSSHRVEFDLPPGGVVRVALGGTGCPVVGRLTLPPDDKTVVDWESSAAHLTTWADAGMPRPSLPTAWDSLPLGERQARLKEWYDTADGAAFRKAEKEFSSAMRRAKNGDSRGYYAAPVHHDGSFRAEDIPAGRYVLSATLRAPRLPTDRSEGKSLGTFVFEFTVPEMPGGRSDQPVDLGECAIRGAGR